MLSLQSCEHQIFLLVYTKAPAPLPGNQVDWWFIRQYTIEEQES